MRHLFAPLLLLLVLAACETRTPEPEAPSFQGGSWVFVETDTAANFIGLDPVDANVVWASGTRGTFARTTDGGRSWTTDTVPGATSLQFRDVHAVSAETAYLLSAGDGENSRIYKTTDGGATWTLQFTNGPEGFFDCLDFWDDNRGLAFSDAVDGEFILLKTDDGENWTRILPENVPDALPGEGGFAASGTCVVTRPGGLGWIGTGASGQGGRVYRTTDYGETWNVVATPLGVGSSTSGIFSLTFLDDQHGAALGGDYTKVDTAQTPNVAITTDGGATWTMHGATNLRGAVYGASYVPGTATPTLVATSPTGMDYSTDDGHTWMPLDSVGGPWSVAFVSPTEGWAAAPRGRLGRFVPAQ